MKKTVLIILLASVCSCFHSQYHIMEWIMADKKGKNKKVIEWLESHPGSYVQLSDLADLYEDYICEMDSVHPLQIAAFYENTTISDFLLGKDEILNDTLLLNNTLASTVHNNKISEITKYLNLGANMSGICNLCYDRNVLQIALGNDCDHEIIELCKQALPENLFSYTDCVERSIVHFYATSNHYYLLDDFIKELESPELLLVVDKEGVTPFMSALWNGQLKNAKLLQLHGGAVIIKDNEGFDLIDYANFSEDYSVIKWVENYYLLNKIPYVKEDRSIVYEDLLYDLIPELDGLYNDDTSDLEVKDLIEKNELRLNRCNEIYFEEFDFNKKEIKNISDYVYYLNSLHFVLYDQSEVKIKKKIFDQLYKRYNILKYSVRSDVRGVFVDFLDEYAEKLASINYKSERDFIYFPTADLFNDNLIELKLSGNISSIPDNVTNFKALRHLSLTFFDDEGVADLFKDKYLDNETLLDFDIKNVSRSIDNLSQLNLLETLIINFRADQPIMDYSFLKNFKNLTFLDLSFNHFKEFPDFMLELKYLETLVLTNTSLSIEDLDKIEKMLPSVNVIWE